MLIGRTQELKLLESAWEEEGLSPLVLYGGRRVGKTALVREFLAGRRAVFFTALESSLVQNLHNLHHAMVLSGLFTEEETGDLTDFDRTLAALFHKACGEHVVLVFDDYPLLARSFPDISRLLTGFVTEYRSRARLLLLVCGSSLSWMETQLAQDGALADLGARVLKLRPLDFLTLHRHFHRYSLQDAARTYGIIGGTPQYLSWLSQEQSLKENVQQHVLTPGSQLFEEPGHLLQQEIREAAMYNAVLSAMATGARRLSDIAAGAGLDTSACTLYLNRLMTLDFVARELPLGEPKNRRKTIYRIKYPLFRFWYRYIPQTISLLAAGRTEEVWERIMQDEPVYMQRIFADICRQWLQTSPLVGSGATVGPWWGRDEQTKERVFVDLVAAEATGDETANKPGDASVGACVWDRPAQASDLQTLQRRARLLPFAGRRLFLFSARGFAPDCRALADALRKEERSLVTLVDFAEMTKPFS